MIARLTNGLRETRRVANFVTVDYSVRGRGHPPSTTENQSTSTTLVLLESQRRQRDRFALRARGEVGCD